MVTEKTKSLRLKIWRPCRWERDVLDLSKSGPADGDHFLECIYSWEPSEDPWGGIPDVQDTQALQENLCDRFAPENNPKQRSISDLVESLKKIDQILCDNNKAVWSDSEETLPDERGVNLRIHRLLAFRNHLKWICDTFADIPGISVTLR